MGLVSWMIIGLSTGGVTNFFFKRRCKLVRAGRVFAGVTGAFLGGFLANILFFGGPLNFTFAWQSILVSLMSAIVLIAFSFAETRQKEYWY